MARKTPTILTPDGREVRLSRCHFARFDVDRHIPLFRELLAVERQRWPGETLWVIDPMAGTCTIHAIAMPGVETIGNEIEPPDVDIAHQLYPSCQSVVGDAADLDYEDGSFHAVITSPDFGNRGSDHHNAKDTHKPCQGRGCKGCGGLGVSLRRSYTHDLRYVTGDMSYQLDPANSGRYRSTDPRYWERQAAYWAEAFRVLKDGGLMVVDVKDGVEAGRVVAVVEPHRQLLESVGFAIETLIPLPMPGLRNGANGELRSDGHIIIVARKGR